MFNFKIALSKKVSNCCIYDRHSPYSWMGTMLPNLKVSTKDIKQPLLTLCQL